MQVWPTRWTETGSKAAREPSRLKLKPNWELLENQVKLLPIETGTSDPATGRSLWRIVAERINETQWSWSKSGFCSWWWIVLGSCNVVHPAGSCDDWWEHPVKPLRSPPPHLSAASSHEAFLFPQEQNIQIKIKKLCSSLCWSWVLQRTGFLSVS